MKIRETNNWKIEIDDEASRRGNEHDHDQEEQEDDEGGRHR